MFDRLLYMWLEWMRRRGSCLIIPRNHADGSSDDYLERYYLLRFGGRSLYLHRFWSSDDEGFHCHPAHGLSLMLRGQYWEEQPHEVRTRRAGSVRFIHAEAFHRISLPKKNRGRTWTLFLRGRSRKRWGFLDPATGRWRVAPSGRSFRGRRRAHDGTWRNDESSDVRLSVQGAVFPRLVPR